MYQELVDRCDYLWSLYIRSKYPTCYHPDCSHKSEEACHTIKRNKILTRWHPDNGLGGCKYHNRLEEYDLKATIELKIGIIGKKKYVELYKLGEKSFCAKLTVDDLIQTEMYLTKLVESFEKFIIKKVTTKQALKKYTKNKQKKDLDNYRAKNNGLSPWQVEYRKQKAKKEINTEIKEQKSVALPDIGIPKSFSAR